MYKEEIERLLKEARKTIREDCQTASRILMYCRDELKIDSDRAVAACIIACVSMIEEDKVDRLKIMIDCARTFGVTAEVRKRGSEK